MQVSFLANCLIIFTLGLLLCGAPAASTSSSSSKFVHDPLYEAVFNADADLVTDLISEYRKDPALLRAGVFPTDPTYVEKEHGRTALMMCGYRDPNPDAHKTKGKGGKGTDAGKNADYKHRQYTDKSCLKIAKMLHSAGANISHEDKHGWNGLSMAAIRGLTLLSEFYLDNGVHVDCKDKDGLTPLLKSVAHGYVETAQMLVRRGADLRQKDADGRTPLMIAVNLAVGDAQFEPKLQWFLNNVLNGAGAEAEAGAGAVAGAAGDGAGGRAIGIDYPTDKHGRTALHYAVIGRSISVTRMLLQNGADPTIADAFGTVSLSMIRHEDEAGRMEMETLLGEGSAAAIERKHAAWLVANKKQHWEDL